ncbi:hypothetical protein K8354_07195 [Polaribacter litorisediminis]|uniref:hypothetical protein n=1 Tax=Polaribacter litorisediminis TaxID=1908341 RepID=UPI001CC1A85D|nr:hypothetical protein [Polaribacter litorisediminis]UAM99581.1 hypothetical protein K8354_07195 [Polaribacter litorisediminis]
MKKFRLKKGINKYKTLKERKYAIKHLRIAAERVLQDGYSPFQRREIDVIKNKLTPLKKLLNWLLKKKHGLEHDF